MDLKDVIAGDIDSVFFNTDEFSEEAIIDGKPVPIILDADGLTGKTEVYAQGLARGEQLIFIKQKDMKRIPNIGEEMSIGDKKWYIKHAFNNAGVFELRIGRDRVYD